MSYYRAALAAAHQGDLSTALRLVRCSLVFEEDAPSAERFFALLNGCAGLVDGKPGTPPPAGCAGESSGSGSTEGTTPGSDDAFGVLRGLAESGRYREALKVRLPHTSKSHTIRGFLYALTGLRRDAISEFALALAMDTGNDAARRGIINVQGALYDVRFWTRVRAWLRS